MADTCVFVFMPVQLLEVTSSSPLTAKINRYLHMHFTNVSFTNTSLGKGMGY